MHSVPGLPVLHSKDLVNWKLLSYALTEFDLGDEFKLEQGKEAYGQGIWAPCIRYHEGVFYIFPISIVMGYKYSRPQILGVHGNVILLAKIFMICQCCLKMEKSISFMDRQPSNWWN